MFDTDRLPIGRAEESLAKTLGPTGGRLWICNQLRSGALAARCSTWRVQTNWWYMPDYPVEAEDYEIPSIFWRVDRARPKSPSFPYPKLERLIACNQKGLAPSA